MCKIYNIKNISQLVNDHINHFKLFFWNLHLKSLNYIYNYYFLNDKYECSNHGCHVGFYDNLVAWNFNMG